MTSVKTSAIAEVISGILDSAEAETIEAYRQVQTDPQVVKAAAAAKAGDAGSFWSLTYTLSQFVDGLLAAEVPQSDEARFLLKHSDFVEGLLSNHIEKHEGFACCCDKAKFLVSRLLHFYMHGNRIVIDLTGKYTFHLPKTVLNTHEEVVEFFNSVRRLYYGRPEKFVALMSRCGAGPEPEAACPCRAAP